MSSKYSIVIDVGMAMISRLEYRLMLEIGEVSLRLLVTDVIATKAFRLQRAGTASHRSGRIP